MASEKQGQLPSDILFDREMEKNLVVCAARSWYQSHWGLGDVYEKDKRKQTAQYDFGVLGAATRTWTC